MRLHLLTYVFVLAICVLAQPALAQDTKVSVSVSHSGEDSAGKQFAYAIREAIRASNGFRLESGNQAGLQVNIITLDPERASSSTSNWTAASISYTMSNFIPFEKGNPQTWYPIYLTSQVMTVGTQRTVEQARAVMATLDDVLEKYRRDIKN
jgi:hypothetical protein